MKSALTNTGILVLNKHSFLKKEETAEIIEIIFLQLCLRILFCICIPMIHFDFLKKLV